MSKSRRRLTKDELLDREVNNSRKPKVQQKKTETKRFDRALKTRDVDYLLNHEEDED